LFDVQASQRATALNQRWAFLARLPKNKIRSIMKTAGLGD
jgi:hypothetical protein